MKKIDIAFLCWLLSFVGIHGAHRIYLGKYVTGVIWFLTCGLFLIGTIIDLFNLQNMANDYNIEQARRTY